MEQRKNNKFLRFLSWGIFAFFAPLILWGTFIEPNRLVVRRTTVELPRLPAELEGCRALVVADTHLGNTFIDRLRRDRIVRYAAAEKPDICFLLGDYIAVGALPHYGTMSPEELTVFFSSFKAPLGTYAVLGNHELWYGRKRMTILLEKAGVRMIENKIVRLKNNFAFAGVPDSSTAAFDRKSFNKFLEKEKPQLLLTHKGGLLKFLTASWKGVLFAADTHGGQFRLPGGPALGAYLAGKKELAPGVSTRWGRTLFVTTGAGGHRIGFRLFCPPEIAVVTLKNRKTENI